MRFLFMQSNMAGRTADNYSTHWIFVINKFRILGESWGWQKTYGMLSMETTVELWSRQPWKKLATSYRTLENAETLIEASKPGRRSRSWQSPSSCSVVAAGPPAHNSEPPSPTSPTFMLSNLQLASSSCNTNGTTNGPFPAAPAPQLYQCQYLRLRPPRRRPFPAAAACAEFDRSHLLLPGLLPPPPPDFCFCLLHISVVRNFVMKHVKYLKVMEAVDFCIGSWLFLKRFLFFFNALSLVQISIWKRVHFLHLQYSFVKIIRGVSLKTLFFQM